MKSSRICTFVASLAWISNLALTQPLLGENGDQPSSSPVDARPVEAAPNDAWQVQAAEHAKLLSQVKWTPVAETMPNRRGGYFVPGKTYTGVPYSSVRSVGRYIGFDISLRTFLAAVENPLSVLYTETLAGKVSNAAGYYGAVCSSYTSYSLQCGIWEMSRHHGPQHKEGVERIDPPTAQVVQVGDIIFTPPSPGSHVEIVTGITKDDQGSVTSIRVEESRPPTTTTTDRRPADFEAHLASRGRQLFRITDLNAWRGTNRAESFLFPNYDADATPPNVNRMLLLDLGDWVPYPKDQPVKFHVMDRDAQGVKSLVISRAGSVVEEIPLSGVGVWERSFTTCGNYQAHVVMKNGANSQACEFSVCDLQLQLPAEPVSLNHSWEVQFTSDNLKPIIVYLWNESDSYGRNPLFLTDEQRDAGKIVIPAKLLKKAGDVQVWLIGEHEYGRLKTRVDITIAD